MNLIRPLAGLEHATTLIGHPFQKQYMTRILQFLGLQGGQDGLRQPREAEVHLELLRLQGGRPQIRGLFRGLQGCRRGIPLQLGLEGDAKIRGKMLLLQLLI